MSSFANVQAGAKAVMCCGIHPLGVHQLAKTLHSMKGHSLRGVVTHRSPRSRCRGRLDSFFAPSPAGLVILDEDLRVIRANDAIAEMVGVSEFEIVGQTPRSLVPNLAPVVEALLRYVLDSGEAMRDVPLSGETPKVRGIVRHWKASIFPISKRRGNKKVGAIAVETTDSVHLEQIRRSQELLAEAERIANVGSWTIDLATSEVTLSPNLRSMLRLEAFRLAEKDVWSLVHPSDRERVRTIVETAIKDRKEHEEQARVVFPDGTEKVFLTRGRPISDATGRAVKAMGITQDITDRVKAQLALEESEARYRDLVENSRSLMCLHDLDGRLLWMNTLPAKLLGYSPDQLIGRRIPEMLGPDSRDGFQEYIETIRRDGRATGLMAVVSRSGEQRIWEYNNTLRTDAPLVRGMAHDITERWRAERLMQRKEEQLRSLSAQLILSHDRERKTIARTLHEGTAQELAGAKVIFLGLLDKPLGPETHSAIDEGLEVIGEAMNQIRAVSNQLHPSMLDVGGLWMAITSYAREFGRETGVRVTVEIRHKIIRLTESAEIGVFRVVQECLSHIHLHAKMKRSIICVAKEDRNVAVTISGLDNAFGSGRHDSPDALGFVEVTERARQFGGTVEFAPGPDEGTVRLLVPTQCSEVVEIQPSRAT